MIDHKDKCSKCGKMVEIEELEEFTTCWECYKKECDSEFDTSFIKDQNVSDFWGLL